MSIGVIVSSRWGSGISSDAQSSARRFGLGSFLGLSFLVTQKIKKDWVVGVGRSLRDVAINKLMPIHCRVVIDLSPCSDQ